jgi:hypothetical protein
LSDCETAGLDLDQRGCPGIGAEPDGFKDRDL